MADSYYLPPQSAPAASENSKPASLWDKQEMEAEFTLKEGGVWYRASMNCKDYLELLRNGTIEGKPVAAIKVCTVSDPESPSWGTCNYVYDFILAKSGANPWRIFGS